MSIVVRSGVLLVSLLLFGCGGEEGGGDNGSDPGGGQDEQLIQLGRNLFFDANLSNPPGQACAGCHDPAAGFADPDSDVPTSEGVVAGLFGSRNTPTSAYAFLSPAFAYTNDPNAEDPNLYFYVGGQFLDGRRSTLEEQAKDPFLNPIEMANPDKASVVNKVQNAAYADMFTTVFGANAFGNIDTAYGNIAAAIAEFERSEEMNPFTSKFDYFQKGMVTLTDEELRGLDVFNVKGKCSICHTIVDPDTFPNLLALPSTFSNFRYFNIGVPANPTNPFYTQSASVNPDGINFIDYGLGSVIGNATWNGKFKTPTLRNVELTSPYMHNGVFATLEEVVEFYNLGTDQFVPEVDQDITADVGFLDLTDQEMADLVAFMKTLTDGYVLP